jgi:hypothetical protein
MANPGNQITKSSGIHVAQDGAPADQSGPDRLAICKYESRVAVPVEGGQCPATEIALLGKGTKLQRIANERGTPAVTVSAKGCSGGDQGCTAATGDGIIVEVRRITVRTAEGCDQRSLVFDDQSPKFAGKRGAAVTQVSIGKGGQFATVGTEESNNLIDLCCGHLEDLLCNQGVFGRRHSLVTLTTLTGSLVSECCMVRVVRVVRVTRSCILSQPDAAVDLAPLVVLNPWPGVMDGRYSSLEITAQHRFSAWVQVLVLAPIPPVLPDLIDCYPVIRTNLAA